MGISPQEPASPQSPPSPRVVVVTIVRDEAELLPLWLDYYGKQFGHQSLFVLDDNTVDGSTDDLPCVCYRLPEGPWKAGWGRTRLRLVNGLAASLLAVNDVVIYADVDEFLVADPESYSGLGDYLAKRTDEGVIAPLAVEVLHNTRSETPLDLSLPILPQRSFLKYSPALCKPLVRRSNSRWHGAFHASASPFRVDPELWMFHLKFADEGLMRKTARAREEAHRLEGRGHPRSFWAMSEEAVAAKLAAWTQATDDVPDLDPAELGLPDLVQPDEDGNWQAVGNQVASLEASPLRRIPDRFRSAF